MQVRKDLCESLFFCIGVIDRDIADIHCLHVTKITAAMVGTKNVLLTKMSACFDIVYLIT